MIAGTWNTREDAVPQVGQGKMGVKSRNGRSVSKGRRQDGQEYEYIGIYTNSIARKFLKVKPAAGNLQRLVGVQTNGQA